MNREILFRGFNEDPNGNEEIELEGKVIKGKWIYGNHVYIKCENKHYIVDFNTNVYSVDTDYEYIIKDLDFIEVISETISQYTGLDNSYEQKIFENDILRDYGNEIEDWKVSYEYGKFVGNYDNICEDLYELSDLEVIGTIFDKEEVSDEKNM